LGKTAWQQSQLIYHALARQGREALVLISPASAYVSIGYNQNVWHEVDLEFCRRHHIPVFRREVGGGAVYLDSGQLFFHLILQQHNPVVPPSKNGFYRKFIEPVIDVYRQIGLPAEFKPVNDILVNGRKISGTGVGEIGDCIVFVGSLILDFNYEMMSRILKVPDEKFRDKVKKTIEDNLTTIRRELPCSQMARWDEATINALIAEAFQRLMSPMKAGRLDLTLKRQMRVLEKRMLSDQWLKGGRLGQPRNEVKIRSGVTVNHRLHKAAGGLMRADFEVAERRLTRISISGDFFCYPPRAVAELETLLEGCSPAESRQRLAAFCSRQEVEIPGIGLQDWERLFGLTQK
jgi:lipoate-protein ligase A